MVAFVLNAIYRQFLRSSLLGMRKLPSPSHRPLAHGQPITGTDCYQLDYFPMTSPLNAAIYAFGGFMLFALAIGFLAAPV
jgi:hypothetical protein